MYTQCSKCETVYKLTPEILRVAGGQVRCGNCGEVFSALARLAEDATAFAPSESALELEARAESILESVVDVQEAEATPTDNDEAASPGVEIARLEVLDWPEEDQAQRYQSHREDAGEPDSADADDDRSLEFTLPPGELDRIFVESKKSAQLPVPEPAAPEATAAQAQPYAESESPSPETAAQPHPSPEPEAPPSAEAERQPSPEPEPESQPSAQPALAPKVLPPHPESAFLDLPTRNRVSGFEVPDDVRRDMLAGFEQHPQHARAPVQDTVRRDAGRRPLIMWLGAAIISMLLLLAQVVHQNREWFIAHAHSPLGAVVRALYGALGSPLPATANLFAYQLRQWGVTGDPDAHGTLRLRASILNSAAELQPYPLLRVSLADRFGKSIAKRDFEPSEYMGRPTARLLAPGERADAILDILDPGKNAEGFEIDVCLRGIDKKISCANDAAAQAKP